MLLIRSVSVCTNLVIMLHLQLNVRSALRGPVAFLGDRSRVSIAEKHHGIMSHQVIQAKLDYYNGKMTYR